MFSVKEATQEDVTNMVPRLLPISYTEFRASGFNSPQDALNAALAVSTVKEAYLADGVVVGIAGIVEGHFWGVLADGVKPVFLPLVKYSRKRLPEFLKEFGKVSGAVHVDNTYIIKWAKLLGFEVSEPYDMGNGEPFVSFNLCVSPPLPPP